MIVFPDNLHTWIIGDGYFDNPFNRDMNYIGPNFGGYYMATDIGYLRFLFYVGLIGLLLFCVYMVACANELMKLHTSYQFHCLDEGLYGHIRRDGYIPLSEGTRQW